MYKGSLSTVLSALLCLQASAGVIHTTDGSSSIGKAVEISHADTVPGLGNSAGSIISNGPSTTNGLNSAAEAKLMRREDPPILQKLNEFATWLTKTPIRADCVFVTIAHLLGTTPEEVSRRTSIPIPQPGDGGTDNIFTLLSRLGLVFRSWAVPVPPPDGGGPIRNGIERPGRRPHLAFPRVTGMPRTVGVAFFYPNERGNFPLIANRAPGHVVVCTNPGTPYARYVDYQADRNGRDITASMRNNRIALYFSIDITASTGDLITTQRPTMEQLEVHEEQTHPGTQDGATQLERPTTSQEEDGAPDTSEPTEVDEEHLNLWASGQFRGLNCLAVISALSAYSQQHSRPGRSLPDVALGGRDRESTSRDCDRARDMATQIQRPPTVPNGDTPSQIDRPPTAAQLDAPSDDIQNSEQCVLGSLKAEVQLNDWNWAGNSDRLWLEIGKNRRYDGGQPHYLLKEGPSAGENMARHIELADAFATNSVTLDKIEYIRLVSRNENGGIGSNQLSLQDIKLTAKCAGSSKIAEIRRAPKPGEEWFTMWNTELKAEAWSWGRDCDKFKSIEFEWQLSSASSAGTSDDLILTKERNYPINKEPASGLIFTRRPTLGTSGKASLNLTSWYGSETVPIGEVNYLQVMSYEGISHASEDQWKWGGATFTAMCDESGKKAVLNKFESDYYWHYRTYPVAMAIEVHDWKWEDNNLQGNHPFPREYLCHDPTHSQQCSKPDAS